MRTLALLAAALAALVVLPSASAMAWVPPPQPDPKCEPTPAPEPGETGILAEAKQIAHDNTQNACDTEENAEDIAGIAYDAGMRQVDIVVDAVINVVGPTVDATQDNVCDAVYGDRDHTNDPGCSEIIVDLSGVPTDIWLGTW